MALCQPTHSILAPESGKDWLRNGPSENQWDFSLGCFVDSSKETDALGPVVAERAGPVVPYCPQEEGSLLRWRECTWDII